MRTVKAWSSRLSLLVALTSVPVRPQQSGHSTFRLRIEPNCSIPNSTTELSDHQDDGVLRGVSTFRYKLRTSGSGGASIQLKLAQPGAQFSYVVRLRGVAAYSGSQVIPESGSVTVAQFGPNSHSSKKGDTGTITWSLQGATGAPPPMVFTIACR